MFVEKNQLLKYLNKEVVIEEKNYQSPSTFEIGGKAVGGALYNKIEGIITDFDADFIELDNTMLISRKFVYRIRLK